MKLDKYRKENLLKKHLTNLKEKERGNNEKEEKERNMNWTKS